MVKNNSTATTNNLEDYNTMIGPLRVVLVLLLRAGSMMIQMGSFPTENVYNIIFQNIVDISVSVTSFSMLGYIFAFGKDNYNNGIIGLGSWMGTAGTDTSDANYAILGVCSVLIGSSIISSLLAGRLHFTGCVIISFMYAGFLQPIIMHWIWNKNGWMHERMFLDTTVTIIDVGGALIIHTTAGLVGLIGMIFLGRRLLRMNELDVASIGAESPNTTFLGYFFMMLGIIGMSLPVDAYKKSALNHIILNSFTSIGLGIIFTLVIQFSFCRDQFNYWGIVRCTQGALNSLILTSPGMMYYSMGASIVISFLGTILFAFISRCVLISSLEDYCNCLALHLVGGLFGSFFPHFFIHNGYTIIFNNFFWQLLCTLFILFVFTVSFSMIFLLLWCCGFLRNKSDEVCHHRSLTLENRCKRKFFLQRFLDFNSKSTFLQPGVFGRNVNGMAIQASKTTTFKRTYPGFRHISHTEIDKPNSSLTMLGDIKNHKVADSPKANVSTNKIKTIFTISNPNIVIHKEDINFINPINLLDPSFAMGDCNYLQKSKTDDTIVDLNALIKIGERDD